MTYHSNHSTKYIVSTSRLKYNELEQLERLRSEDTPRRPV